MDRFFKGVHQFDDEPFQALLNSGLEKSNAENDYMIYCDKWRANLLQLFRCFSNTPRIHAKVSTFHVRNICETYTALTAQEVDYVISKMDPAKQGYISLYNALANWIALQMEKVYVHLLAASSEKQRRNVLGDCNADQQEQVAMAKGGLIKHLFMFLKSNVFAK